jgi:hypothetical protein
MSEFPDAAAVPDVAAAAPLPVSVTTDDVVDVFEDELPHPARDATAIDAVSTIAIAFFIFPPLNL